MDGADAVAPRARNLPLPVKLAYGVGEMGEGLKTAALETFLFFFYVQVVGLSGALTGAALLLALLFDGFSDPLVGGWSDRTRTRLGRRHPFLYAAPVPLALALVALFSPPALPPPLLFAWLAGFAILARFTMTLYFVPHMALGAELSRDFHERVSLGGHRTLFGYLGRMLALALAFSIFFAHRPGFRNGQLDAMAYPPLAVALGVLVIVFVIGSALGTQRTTLARAAQELHRPATHGPLRTLMAAMRSPSFRALFVALLVMYSYNGVQGALALHMNTYFWRLPPQQVQLVLYASMLGFIAGIPLARPAAHRWDKKAAYMTGVAGSCIVGSAPTILRLANLMPPNGDPSLLPMLIGASFGAGFIGAIPVVLSAAMLGDVSDEYDLLHGGRAEGLFFGANAFCRKASLGVGGAVAGVVIDLIHFPRKAAPASIPEGALDRLGLAYAPMMLAVLLAGLALMLPYRIDRRRHAEIAEALDGRGPAA